MSNDGNKHISICSHDISYFFRDTDLDIDECGEEHITELIVDGYVEGELNITDPENPEEVYYGYWQIVKEN